ncbi:mediator of RNA polymerase II transcription subunit 4 [Drosophila sulfurigaster albostrigata]|uniref:Mediator of RNA polymerase II transcription subunit 4 n=1 Tax=Drosophila albomicans TaxID=7291 RepID=A0A6P8YVU4_DROAB|nr:mediator of RNA polymerase II transcription subunit 4 [Drosophila albomicans]XP_060652794.1 mediator of RNA polymerase II transcription subunit 4 [Drosophila nasuta]XP_062127453.1 mediator of RNA polymerase II transcription subunit 4 [Drosophila sulfurigaster albostrigata]
MSFHLSTKDRLLQLIDDMEMISKELIDQAHQKISTTELVDLLELLVSKDEEMRRTFELAEEQAKVEDATDKLLAKVEVHDREIQKLQKSLKDAELILSTAIFQARQKLASINQANRRPVSSEELIKYAHRISSANAVSAPLTWCIGDLRRPYPTDIEMRNGLLGKSEQNINGGIVTHQNSAIQSDTQRSLSGASSAGGGEVPNAFQNQFSWNLGELHMMGASGNSVALETRAHKESSAPDDVEVMSTDSSSSSSSDSQ